MYSRSTIQYVENKELISPAEPESVTVTLKMTMTRLTTLAVLIGGIAWAAGEEGAPASEPFVRENAPQDQRRLSRDPGQASRKLGDVDAAHCTADIGARNNYTDYSSDPSEVAGFYNETGAEVLSAQRTFERGKLVEFYDNAGGPYWCSSSGWLNDASIHCMWYGITCNLDGLVVEVHLQTNNVTDDGIESFPADDFPELKRLILREEEAESGSRAPGQTMGVAATALVLLVLSGFLG